MHLARDAWGAKFDLLIEMMRKLFAYVDGDVCADNPDALQNHEVLLGEHSSPR